VERAPAFGPFVFVGAAFDPFQEFEHGYNIATQSD
jgi:hypothetical protein